MQIPLCNLLAHGQLLLLCYLLLWILMFFLLYIAFMLYLYFINILTDTISVLLFHYPLCCCNNVNFPIVGQ